MRGFDLPGYGNSATASTSARPAHLAERSAGPSLSYGGPPPSNGVPTGNRSFAPPPGPPGPPGPSGPPGPLGSLGPSIGSFPPNVFGAATPPAPFGVHPGGLHAAAPPPEPSGGSAFGTWSELIAGGVVDRSYIEAEAERRKQEIDRSMGNQLAQLETQCQEQSSSIQQQAEYHTQMAEQQIETTKRQHLAHVTRQAELQAYAIVQRAEMEKGRLGQEACRALSMQSEREKAAVMHDAMRKAEEMWRQSQRALLEQAQKQKAEIDSKAQKRTSDIEREVRQAVSRVYISPHSPMAPTPGAGSGMSSGIAPGSGIPGYGSFVPAPSASA